MVDAPGGNKRKTPTGVRSACDECRRRRVLCVFPRLDGQDGEERGRSCVLCSRPPGKPCTFTPHQRKKRRAAPASASPAAAAPIATPVESTSSNSPAYNSSAGGSFSSKSSGYNALSMVVAPQGLNDSILGAGVFHSLLDHFLDVSPGARYQYPLDEFKSTCEARGYNLAALAPDQRALALAIMGVASLSSGHKAIIKMDSDAALVQKNDMRMVGWARRSSCFSLWTQAVEEAEKAQVWRSSSPLSQATCHQLDLMENRHDRQRTSRPWASARAHHLRNAELCQGLQLAEGVLYVSIVNVDCTSSLLVGCPPSISLDDERFLFGKPLSERTEQPPLSSEFNSILNNMSFLSGQFAVLGRRVHTNFVSRHARSQRFAHDEAEDLLQTFDGLSALLEGFAATTKTTSVKNRAENAIGNFPLLLAWSYTSSVFAVHRELQRRLKEVLPQDGQSAREAGRLSLLSSHFTSYLRHAIERIATICDAFPEIDAPHLHAVELDRWGELALELSRTESINPAPDSAPTQPLSTTFSQLSDALKRYSWTWADELDLVGRLDKARLDALGNELLADYSANSGWAEGMVAQTGSLDDLDLLFPPWVPTQSYFA